MCPGSITNGRYAYLSRQANLKFATVYINKRVQKSIHAQNKVSMEGISFTNEA